MDLILFQPGDTSILGESLIDGDVKDIGTGKPIPPGTIQLLSLSHGMSQQITTDVSNTARTSGKPNIQDFTCHKYMDASSPKLYTHCLAAKPVGSNDKLSYIYLCRNAPSGIINIMSYSLENALISSIHTQANPGDMPTETFTLNFTAITWTYTVQDSDATAKGNVAAAWNVATDRNPNA